MFHRVALVRCESYEFGVLKGSLRKLLELLGGASQFVREGEKVLLKINLLSARTPEEAVTTHPNLVEALVELIKEVGGIPAIGDSPGGMTSVVGLAKAYRISQLEEVSRKTGVPLLSFEEDAIEVENREGFLYKKFTVTRRMKEFDVIISLPKLKTHPLTYLTAGVKNSFGFIPGLRKSEFHLKLPERDSFSQMLIDLVSCTKIDLVILDGVVAMEGNGPSSGIPRKVGALLASGNPIALDFVACQLIGYENPLDIPTNRIAVERGIFFPEDIDVLGERVEDLRVRDFKRYPQDVSQKIPKILLKWLKGFISPKPKILRKLCSHCYSCLENCPVGSIDKRRDGEVSFRYPECIRCFCCQELCPQGAIISKRNWLVRLFAS